MKADFGKDKKKTHKAHSEVYEGGFSRMVKERKNRLPELEDTINEILKDYDGSTICIIRVREDENGDPEGHGLFIGGVSKLESQVALSKALSDASDEVRDKLIEEASDNPKLLGALLGALMSEIKRTKE